MPLFSILEAKGDNSLVEMYKSDLKLAREEIARLREQIAMLRLKLFGSQTEKLSKLAETLIEEEEETEPRKTPTTAPAPTPVTETPQAKDKQPIVRKRKLKLTNVRTCTHRIFPQEVQQHPELYELMNEREPRRSYRLERVPAHLLLHIYECPAFVLRSNKGKDKDSAPLRAIAPAGPMNGSIMGASIMAHCVYDKYIQHLPLYRQIKDFQRLGLHNVSEGNLCHWTTSAAGHLEPLWRKMHELVLQSPCLHADETPVRRLKGNNRQGYMWLASSAEDGRTFYMWSETRGAETNDRLLRHGMNKNGAAYDGILVTDGYPGYDSWIQGLPRKNDRCAKCAGRT